MAAPQVISPPPGFELEAPVAAAPPPPPGFTLEQAGTLPPPPSGFVVETDSPAAPAASGSTALPAPPLGAFAAPARAGAPVTPDELDLLAARLGVSPETPPPTGPLTPLPPAAPELRDASRGFLNNISLRELANAPRHGAAAGVLKWLTGSTDAEQERRRRALGQDTDPIDREFQQALETVYQAGGYDSPDYQRLDAAHKNYLTSRDNPEFDLPALWAALGQGETWAEFVKAAAADPELLLTPLGWGKAAGAAANLAKAAGASKAAVTAAKVAGGTTGAGATGAAVTFPVSVGTQLGERGTVDPGRTAKETAVGAMGSAAAANVFVGLGAGLRALRNLKTRPGVDGAAVDAEIAALMKQAETEAAQHGLSPEQTRAEAERFAVDTEAGGVVRPRPDILDGLPGEARAPAAEPAPRPLPDFASEADLRRAAHTEKARKLGLNEEQAAAFAPEEHPDPLTGLQGRRDREPTLKRALAHVEATGDSGQYVALDVTNLGGLNAHLGEPGADRVLKAFAAIAREELDALPGKTNIFRHGGDEMSAVVVGVDEPTLVQALDRIRQRAAAWAEREGLSGVPHPKAGKEPGTGLYYGYAPLRRGKGTDDVLTLAHDNLEAAKRGDYVHSQLSETARASGSRGQAGRAEGLDRPEGQDQPGIVLRPAGGPSALPRDVSGPAKNQPLSPAAARQRGTATEYERLARATDDPVIRQELLRQAELARTADRGGQPKLTPAERYRKARRIDTATDDAATVLRKVGGLDVRRETAGAGSDFAGRFKHLPRDGFGLPAMEQYKGGGHSIDTLTEIYHDLGFLENRSADEMYDLLDRISRGEKIYSFHANPEKAYAKHLPEQQAPRSTDDDWTFHGPDEDLRDRDFVIDTDAGRVAPARLVNEEDLVRLREEELAHERWFEQESGSAEQSGRPADTGTARLPERVAREPQGRPGTEPQPGETGDFPGIEPRNRTRQELADRQREVDTRLRGARDVPPGEGEGDLFSGRAKQTDIEDVAGKPKADDFKLREPTPDELPARAARGAATGRGAGTQLDLFLTPHASRTEHLAALEAYGPRIQHVQTGTFPSALKRATTPDAIAHAIAPLRKQAQESFVIVVTDDDGNILRIGRVHTGMRESTSVDPGIVAGIAANTPGGRRAWFVHNHPSGNPVQSAADKALTGRLHELLRDSGVEPQGMITVAPGGRFTYYHPGAGPHLVEGEARVESHDASGTSVSAIPAAARRGAVPVTERRLTGFTRRLAHDGITSPDEMAARFKAVGDREGVLLLDNKTRPVGFLPLSAEELRTLRQGEGGPGHRLLAAIDETNPSALAARVKMPRDSSEWRAAAGNLAGFAKTTGLRLFDVFDDAFVSGATHNAIPDQSTFYANPFIPALADMARDIGRNIGRNAAAGAAGGVFGATLSDDKPGSAKWWLDVAAGVGAGVLGAQFLRRTHLLGKGSIVDNWRARTGDWIETLPLIGRGPEELRDLKRKQRLMQDYLDRQTAEVGKQLLDRFTPDERAMMADLIETRGIVKDLNVIHRQAQALDDYLAQVARQMKALKMLPPDLEEGGYLHRYYAKHLGLDKLFKEAKGQSLSGSYTIARGTDDTFKREYFSPGAEQVLAEFEKLKATVDRLERLTPGLLDADTQQRITTAKARLRELGKIELREYLGQENGVLRSYLFAPDEVARVDAGFKPAQVDRHPPAAGSLDLRTVPQAPVKDLRATNYRWTVRGVKDKEALLHRDWTKYERQSWGEIEDAGYRYVRGMMEVSHDLSLATLYDVVARKSEWVAATPPTKPGDRPWVFVPKTKVGPHSPLEKYGALAGKYVRPDVWAGIKNYGRNPLRGGPKIPGTGVGLGDAYLASLNKWKLYKTVYNPVTHFNNTYSNVEMLYMGGYSPAEIGRGLKHMLQGEKSVVWREARDQGLFGSDWTTSLLSHDGHGSQALVDLAEQLRTQPDVPDAMLATSLVMDVKKWWVESANALDKADGAWKTGGALATAMGKPLLRGVGFTTKPVKAAGRAMQRAYRFEDNLFKMAVFAAERAKGSNVLKATDAAERLFFDYQDLPEAIKLVRDLPVGSPFISYTYFAVQAIARNVAQNPERVLALVAGYEALNYAVQTSQGVAPGEYWATESAEDATAPPWDKGHSLWGARNTVHMPFLEGYQLSLGRSHALGNPFMTEAGGREKLPEMPAGAGVWGSSVFGGSPLHALLDVSVNEDWKGKAIYKPGAPAEEKAKKIAAYLYQAWAPSNPLTPGGYQQSKILEGLANDARSARKEGRDPGVIGPVVDAANATSAALGFGQFTGLDRADNEIVTRDALLASFGVKLRPIRTEQSVELETGKHEKEKKKVADWFQERSRLNAEGRITDAQFADDERAFDRALEAIDKDQDKLFDAEAFLRKRTPTPPRKQP